MTHLFISREYPPAPYPPGGIGTYVRHMTELLARAGETVHVIAHRWERAPDVRTELLDGRLVVHRVALDQASPEGSSTAFPTRLSERVPRGLLASCYPSQAFSWQASLLAERLVGTEGIDVIEAQEWEAPLYYFQLRRALGLGPPKRPPCVVHLHSPSERIFAANEWDTTLADYPPAIEMEQYSITAADAVLGPSRFVVEEASSRYHIEASRMSVIPYPMGEGQPIERTGETWTAGSICHIGRLELRKGVLELADAVARVCTDHPEVMVEFAGGDTPLHGTGATTVGDAVRARVPREVKRRLRFHGSCDRARMSEILSRAWAAVVPSRWENFPYSCIESMASGLPIIASPNGGMSEIVSDGVSGWIAKSSTPSGLADTLRRALDAPAAEREAMGHAAAARVRRVCDNDSVVAQHLALKGRLVAAGARRSLEIPSRSLERRDCLRAVAPRGIGVVLTSSSAKDAAIEDAATLLSSEPELAGIAFVDIRTRLSPEFVEAIETVLLRHAHIGIVSPWIHEVSPRDRVRVQPRPALPYIWHDRELSPCTVVRTEALKESVGAWLPSDMVRTRRDLFERIVKAGWDGLTYPAVLGSIVLDTNDPATQPSIVRYSAMARAVQRLHTPALRWFLDCPADERRAFVHHIIRHPLPLAAWLAARIARPLRRRPAAPQESPSADETRRTKHDPLHVDRSR